MVQLWNIYRHFRSINIIYTNTVYRTLYFIMDYCLYNRVHYVQVSTNISLNSCLYNIYHNARKKCEYFNCASCFSLALFWCALIRLLHMRVCLALAVIAQINRTRANEQFCSNRKILFSYFFLALRYLIHTYRLSQYFCVHYILPNLSSKVHIAKIGIAKINVCIH